MISRSRVLILGLALVMLSLGCSVPSSELPRELLGRWATDDPRFEGRALELRPGSVTFTTGIEPPATHGIIAVAAASSEGRYAIRYLVDVSAELTLDLYFDPTTDSIVLVNRPEVRWKREDS